MKWIVSVSLHAGNLISAQAPWFGPESLAGSVAASVIGHKSGRRAAECAAVHADAGGSPGAVTSRSCELGSCDVAGPLNLMMGSGSLHPRVLPVVRQPRITTVVVPRLSAPPTQSTAVASVPTAASDPAPSWVLIPGTPVDPSESGSVNGFFRR